MPTELRPPPAMSQLHNCKSTLPTSDGHQPVSLALCLMLFDREGASARGVRCLQRSGATTESISCNTLDTERQTHDADTDDVRIFQQLASQNATTGS